MSLSIDEPVIATLLVGLSIGYLVYIFVHHQIHHGRLAGRYLDAARTRHNRHHHDVRCDFWGNGEFMGQNIWDAKH